MTFDINKAASNLANTKNSMFGNILSGGGESGPKFGLTGTDWATLATGLGGSVIGAIAGNKQNKANLAFERERLAADQARSDKDRALSATQLDPFAQQRSRQKQALLGMLTSNFQPASYSDGKFSGGIMGLTPEMFKSVGSFFGPEAMYAQEGAFHQTARNASPQYANPLAKSVGYGDIGAASGGTQVPGGLLVNPNIPIQIAKLGGNKAGNVGGAIGAAAGSLIPIPGVGSVVGGALGSGLGKLIGGLTYTGGERTNDLRDQFVNQFGGYGALAGSGVDNYSGYTGAMGELGQLLASVGRPDLFNQLRTASNQSQVNAAMQQIAGLINNASRSRSQGF